MSITDAPRVAFLIFTQPSKLLIPSKNAQLICAHKTNNTNEIITSNNTTKQPNDIGQLVTSHSCDAMQTSPPSQMHEIEIILFRWFFSWWYYMIIWGVLSQYLVEHTNEIITLSLDTTIAKAGYSVSGDLLLSLT